MRSSSILVSNDGTTLEPVERPRQGAHAALCHTSDCAPCLPRSLDRNHSPRRHRCLTPCRRSSLLAGGAPHQTSKLALATVVLSHLFVQIVKRTVVRSRPAKVERFVSLVNEPDCFSFPSGHATASMSVALVYGSAFPVWAAPLLLLALLVGFSRVRLRVHYPSDVLVGQLIAGATASVVASL